MHTPLVGQTKRHYFQRPGTGVPVGSRSHGRLSNVATLRDVTRSRGMPSASLLLSTSGLPSLPSGLNCLQVKRERVSESQLRKQRDTEMNKVKVNMPLAHMAAILQPNISFNCLTPPKILEPSPDKGVPRSHQMA